MTTALNNLYRIINNAVDQPVLFVDSSTPPSRVVTTKLFRFSESCVPISLDVCDEFVNAQKKTAVSLTGCIVLPGFFGK